MGFAEAEKICKKHPYHDQKHGVCPSCLREKLSQLYVITSSHNNKVSMIAPSCSSSDPSSPKNKYMFSSSSNRESPGQRKHQRHGSEVLGSVSFRVGGSGGLIKKSRSSIGFVSRNHTGEIKNVKKKKGFWSKLLHLKEKKEVLVH